MSGAEAENDRRQRESCVLMKAKPPTLTPAGWEHIASAADNVRLPTKRVATEPQEADHGPSGPRHMGSPGVSQMLPMLFVKMKCNPNPEQYMWLSGRDYLIIAACAIFGILILLVIF